MEYKNFIDNLLLTNANYINAEYSITTAILYDTISRDINTDSQRFIYKLLQNKDASSNQSRVLDDRVDFTGDLVVVYHKGESFSKIDIESMSIADDETKALYAGCFAYLVKPIAEKYLIMTINNFMKSHNNDD